MPSSSTNSGVGSPPFSVAEAIKVRRAVRRFDPDRTIPDVQLLTLLELATLAPSPFNLQPWRFLVVRKPSNRKRLRGCAFNQPVITEAPVILIVLGFHHPHRAHLDAMIDLQRERGGISAAQAAETRARAWYSMERVTDPSLWATRSAMLAAGTLILAAESLGIGSNLVSEFDPAAVKDAFGIPDDHTVCCLIALGFPVETEPFPGRFGLEEVCFEEHFGQPWNPRRDGLDSGTTATAPVG